MEPESGDFASPSVAPTGPAALSLRIQEVAAKVDGIADLLQVVRVIAPNDERFNEVEKMGLALAGDVIKLRQLPPGGEPFLQCLSRFEAVIDSAEQQILDIDAQVPEDVFRHHYESSRFSEEAKLRYFALLTRFVGAVTERSERLEFLAGQLFSCKNEDGTRATFSREDVDPALDYVIRDASAAESSRRSALNFFASAAGRLQQLETVSEVFDSDFYFDVEGFKIALRDALVDRDVLYGTVRLTTAMHNRIARLVKREVFSEEILLERVAFEHRRLAEIFSALPEELTVPRFEWLKKEKKKRKYRRVTWEDYSRGIGIGIKPGRRQAIMKVVVVLLFLAIGVQVFFMNREPSIEPMPVGQLLEISSLLQKGGLSDSEPLIFIGHFQSGRWRILSGTERREAAEELRQELKALDVIGATIYCDDNLAIQIDKDQVVLVR